MEYMGFCGISRRFHGIFHEHFTVIWGHSTHFSFIRCFHSNYGRKWKKHGRKWKKMEEHGRKWKKMEENGRKWKNMEELNPLKHEYPPAIKHGYGKSMMCPSPWRPSGGTASHHPLIFMGFSMT